MEALSNRIAKGLAPVSGQGLLHIRRHKRGNSCRGLAPIFWPLFLVVCDDILVVDVWVDGVGGAEAVVGDDEVTGVKGSGAC